jgi:predicted nucleotide-binding protein
MANTSKRNQPEPQRPKPKSDYPKHTLEEALAVAQALAEKHGGQPLPPTDTAIALGISPGSSDFRVLLSSSFKYGLTTGSYNQEKVSLTDLARAIVEPRTPEERKAALLRAALLPPTFQTIYNFLRGKKLPEAMFFQNTVVREFEVPREHALNCIEIFSKTLGFVGLIREATSGKWVGTEASTSNAPNTQKSAASVQESALESNGDPEKDGETAVFPEPPAPALPKEERKASSFIFIGHGRNKGPLEQLKELLNQYRIPYRVAVEEANEFRPISQKVADIMKECTAAILLFTADTEYKDASSASVWKPSENVIYELGAASVLYGDKIIIFKESTVNFPTNFRDIGHISFDKDQLAGKVNELFKELISFGLIKITVGS